MLGVAGGSEAADSLGGGGARVLPTMKIALTDR